MADPALLTGTASPGAAAAFVDLIREAGAIATAHFDTLPDGEGATAYVNLNAGTGYGVIPLASWGFIRDADGTVTLIGSDPEEDPRG